MDARVLAKIKTSLNSNRKIQLALVYGSTAKGSDTGESDFDLAVAGRDRLSLTERDNIRDAIEKICSRKVDVLDLQVVRGTILEEAICSGKFLIKKNESIYADLLRKLWYDNADFIPYYDRILKVRRERFLNGK